MFLKSTLSLISKDFGDTKTCLPVFITALLSLFFLGALKQMVISISGLYLSSIRSILFKLIKLNLVLGFVVKYFFISSGTIVSAKEGVVPIFIKSVDLDLKVFAI